LLLSLSFLWFFHPGKNKAQNSKENEKEKVIKNKNNTKKYKRIQEPQAFGMICPKEGSKHEHKIQNSKTKYKMHCFYKWQLSGRRVIKGGINLGMATKNLTQT